MYKYLLLSALTLLLFSCERESNLYSVGDSLVDAQSRIMMIDTLSLKMSTVMKDSVVTSGKSKMLIGNINSSTFGKINSSSFFELTPESYKLTDPTKAVYDSTVMYLTYNDYYYGDTLKTFKLDVFPVTQRIKLDEGYLYNTSNTDYSSVSVGSAEFLPRPETDSTYVRIPLAQSYGQSIFNLLKTGDVDGQEYFLNYYKGLTIVPASDNNAMLRYGISSSYIVDQSDKKISTLVRIYYHTPSENGTEPVKYTLDLNPSTTYQYNKVSYDFSGSELDGLSPKHPLESTSIGNKSYMMAGIGVYTRVEIPYLKTLKSLAKNYSVLSAYMYLSPVAGYYSNIFYNPTPLYYYIGDNSNNIVSSFTDSSSNEVTIALDSSSEFQNDYKYSFPISTYVNTVLNETVNNNYNLLIYPSANRDAMVNKLALGDRKNSTNPAKVQLYLIAY